jgi:O-antigen/teichoic acid export membrane protein
MARARRMRIRRLLEIGGLASIPQVVDFATRFGRTVVLAHMLTTVEFGVSVAFTVAVTIAELASDFGVNKFLLSRRAGGDADALAAVHTLLLLRGIVISGAMLSFSHYIAQLFGAPGETAGFRWVAAILLIRNFEHLEMVQITRDFRFRRGATAHLSSRLCAFVVVYPAALLFRDHRAMLASLLVSAVVYVLASHLLAKSPYRLVVRDRRIIREALSYGLPLTLNGIGIAASSQVDRALVSHWLGIGSLALYAVILNLSTVPVALMLGVLSSLGLPFLARAAGHSERGHDVFIGILWLCAVVAAAYAVFTASTLGLLVPLVFGRTYEVPLGAQLLVALVAWARINKGAPGLLLLVEGDTGRLMIANLASGIGPIMSAALLWAVPRLEVAVACVLAGEIVSLAVLLQCARRRAAVAFFVVIAQIGWSLVPPAIVSLGLWSFSTIGLGWRVGLLSTATLIALAQALYGFRRYFRGGELLSGMLSPEAEAR